MEMDRDQSAGRPGERTPGRRNRPHRIAAEVYARQVAAAAVVAIVAGVVVLAVAGGVAASVAGIVLVGVGGIALVSVVFLLVGASEERDRSRHPRG
jgi:hypothetical protein